jgi:hypothetical protein
MAGHAIAASPDYYVLSNTCQTLGVSRAKVGRTGCLRAPEPSTKACYRRPIFVTNEGECTPGFRDHTHTRLRVKGGARTLGRDWGTRNCADKAHTRGIWTPEGAGAQGTHRSTVSIETPSYDVTSSICQACLVTWRAMSAKPILCRGISARLVLLRGGQYLPGPSYDVANNI